MDFGSKSVRPNTSNLAWRGWRGERPPYQVPVFVLTHHPRAASQMNGGSILHFATHGMLAALQAAKRAAGTRAVRIGGGVAAIRQYLRAALIDELHLATAAVMLGAGEHWFAALDMPQLGYQLSERRATENATHALLTQRAA